MDNVPSKDLIIEFIKDPSMRANYPEYSDIDICSLIKMTGDVEFMKQCVEDDSLTLSNYDKKGLILAVGNRDFVKQCIENYTRNDEYQWTGEYEYRELIEDLILTIKDVEFTKRCINDNSLVIGEHEKRVLIISTGDVEYIKSCIDDDSFGFSNLNKSILISATGDVEYIKRCINDDSLDFSEYEKCILVEATRDVEYIKRCLKDDSLDFSEYEKCQLILSIGDVEFIKQCVRDNSLGISESEKQRLVLATEDVEFIKQCVQDDSLGFSGFWKQELALKTNDIEFIKQCTQDDSLGIYKTKLILFIKDEELIKRFIKESGQKLNFYERESLVRATGNSEFIKECLKDNSHVFSFEERVSFLERTYDVSFVKECIEESFTSVEMKIKLIGRMDDISFIEECIANPKLGLKPSDKISILQNCSNSFLQDYIKERKEDLSNSEKIKLLLATDSGFLKECINSGMVELPESVISKILSADNFSEIEYELSAYLKGKDNPSIIKNTRTNIVIGDVSQLSLEKLENMPDIQTINVSADGCYIYTRDEYVRVRRRIDELLEGVQLPQKGSKYDEIEVFKEIYTRLAYEISYDIWATSSYTKDDDVLQENCRNLYNGLINGCCVCMGYAEILRNVLSCVGIESRIIVAFPQAGGEGHAWNQVRIGGKWFDVDLTNDRNQIIQKDDIDIVQFLKKDSDYENIKRYSEVVLVNDGNSFQLNKDLADRTACYKYTIGEDGISLEDIHSFPKGKAKEVAYHEEEDTYELISVLRDGSILCDTDAHELFKERTLAEESVKVLGDAVKSFRHTFKLGWSNLINNDGLVRENGGVYRENGIDVLCNAVRAFASKYTIGLSDLKKSHEYVYLNELAENHRDADLEHREKIQSRHSRSKTQKSRTTYDEMDEI